MPAQTAAARPCTSSAMAASRALAVVDSLARVITRKPRSNTEVTKAAPWAENPLAHGA